MLLVATANCLLASSIGDPQMAWFSVFVVIVGFIIVDRLEWIDLSGWVANIVLIGVLYFTMRNFVGGNSSGKLISVANLLAYLQLTLYYQKKTPRLCWQLIVLGILQVILAAIFNLNFEHAIFFLLYFAFATAALYFQHDYQDWFRTVRANQEKFQLAKSNQVDQETQPAVLSPLLVLSRPKQNFNLFRNAIFGLPWLFVSVIFAMIMFHSLPHSRQNWQGATESEFTPTGRSLSVKVDIDDFVTLSNKLHFRARFTDLLTGEQVIVNEQPYFRGMALSKLDLENNVTNWVAPYDHIFEWSYSKPSTFIGNEKLQKHARPVELEIILEPNTDPLLYSTFPIYKQQRGESDVEFCRDISALTRRRSAMANNIASYVYRVITLLDNNDMPYQAWPYKPFAFGSDYPTLEKNSPEYLLNTEIDRPRYDKLIQIADALHSRVESENTIDICEAFLKHFSAGNRYRYTLDYRNVEKDKSLDPIEDFVRNHRQGHCTMYASALTLMLRSQGIPARYVVGFHGAKYNNLTSCYVIHGRNAHAWVEAYIPPEHCSEEMFEKRSASPSRGAWLTLDPTPPGDDSDSLEAFDLARSIWQDYVISPDANKQGYNPSNSLLRKSSQDTMFGNYFVASVEIVKQDRQIQMFMMAGFLMLLFFGSLRNRTLRRRVSRAGESDLALGASWFSRAIATISPSLAQWIDRRTEKATIPFYVQMEKIIHRYFGLRRSPELTQKEFAQTALSTISASNSESHIVETAENVLQNVTDAFYKARFSSIPLDNSTIDNIENQLQNLEQILKQSKSKLK